MYVFKTNMTKEASLDLNKVNFDSLFCSLNSLIKRISLFRLKNFKCELCKTNVHTCTVGGGGGVRPPPQAGEKMYTMGGEKREKGKKRGKSG